MNRRSFVLGFALVMTVGCGGVTVESAGGASSSTSSSGASSSSTSSASSSGIGGASSSSSGIGGASSSSSSGIGGASSSSSSGVGGGPTCASFGDPCTACMSSTCPATYCACTGEMDCIPLIECTNACKADEACKQGCLTAHPSGISQAVLLGDCASTTCAAACPNSGPPLSMCTKCEVTSCSAETDACLAAPECQALYKCIAGCPQLDLMCQQQCYTDHGAGIPTLQPLLMCTKNSCPACL